jgi:hypothetical protein
VTSETERRGAELETAFVAVDLELIAVAAPDDIEQSFDHLRLTEQIPSSAEPAPQQSRRRQLEQSRGAVIVVHDLEIERLATAVAYRRQRQHALIGGGKNRIEQIVLRRPFVDIGADQRATPA